MGRDMGRTHSVTSRITGAGFPARAVGSPAGGKRPRMKPYVQARQRQRAATGRCPRKTVVRANDRRSPNGAQRFRQRGQLAGIELAGTEPFLRGGLTLVEAGAEDRSQVRIDLSRTRLADPLTLVGST